MLSPADNTSDLCGTVTLACLALLTTLVQQVKQQFMRQREHRGGGAHNITDCYNVPGALSDAPDDASPSPSSALAAGCMLTRACTQHRSQAGAPRPAPLRQPSAHLEPLDLAPEGPRTPPKSPSDQVCSPAGPFGALGFQRFKGFTDLEPLDLAPVGPRTPPKYPSDQVLPCS